MAIDEILATYGADASWVIVNFGHAVAHADCTTLARRLVTTAAQDIHLPPGFPPHTLGMPRIVQWDTADVDVLLDEFAALRSTGCILVVLIGDDALPKLLGDFWVDMEDVLLDIDMSVYKTSQKAVESMLQAGVGEAMLKVAAQEILMETA